MILKTRFALITIAGLMAGIPANADDVKELKTEAGKAIIVANFVSPPADCSSNPTPQPLPVLREKPRDGAVGMQILASDVAATGACPARKVPSLALFYLPKQGFAGVDALQIEVDTGTKISILKYRIVVQPASAAK